VRFASRTIDDKVVVSWTIQAELTAAMWEFARKNWKTNIAFQGGRTTSAASTHVARCSALATGRRAKGWLRIWACSRGTRRRILAADAHVRRSLNSQPDAIAAYAHDGDPNFAVDNHLFAYLAT
jgi:hypothetical protein